jgi:hypothetical protein
MNLKERLLGLYLRLGFPEPGPDSDLTRWTKTGIRLFLRWLPKVPEEDAELTAFVRRQIQYRETTKTLKAYELLGFSSSGAFVIAGLAFSSLGGGWVGAGEAYWGAGAFLALFGTLAYIGKRRRAGEAKPAAATA